MTQKVPPQDFNHLQVERIGIDFGTSNTVVAVLGRKGLEKEQEVHRTLPIDSSDVLKSLLYFPNSREAFFGAQAIEQYFERDREGRFFQSVKRLLPNPEFLGTQIGGRFLSLEGLIGRFLAELKRRIEIQVPQAFSRAEVVFGRPAKYSLDSSREELATRRFRAAIEQAGFTRYELMEEPTAASRLVTHKQRGGETKGVSSHESPARDRVTLVADLGGGTSDFTVLKHTSGKPDEVLAVHGIPLAGDALDSAWVAARLLPFFGSEVTYQRPFSSNVLTFPKSLMSRLPKWHQHVLLKEKSNWNFILDLRKELVRANDLQFLENLITLVEENLGYLMHQRVEELKIAVSSNPRDTVFPFSFSSHPIAIELSIAREEYARILTPVVERIAEAAEETLKQAGLQAAEVATLTFTGGTARVPQLRTAIQALVPQAHVEDQDSFTAVALGLSLV